MRPHGSPTSFAHSLNRLPKRWIHFFNFSWVDYSTHKPGTFRLAPPANHLAYWKADYEAMLGPMFFGDTPTFDEM